MVSPMSFNVKQMPASSDKNLNEDEDEVNVAKLQRFKIGFAGIVLVCLCVIVGSAIFYYQLGY